MEISSIPLYSIVAKLLLDKREVSFIEISSFMNIILNSSDVDIDIIDDMSAIDDLVDITSDVRNGKDNLLKLKDGLNYDADFRGGTVRDYLISLSSCLDMYQLKCLKVNPKVSYGLKKKRTIFKPIK